MADLDDIEDMIGEEELNRAAMDATRMPMVAPKHTAGDANVSVDTAASVPGTQLIWLKTYGCSHNVSDSEYMQGVLASYGYRFTQNADEAQLWLLNSCTVKDPSQAAFMHLVIKGKSQSKAVVVAGCVPQADRHIKGLENVSIVGIQQVDRVVEVVEETLKGHTVRLLSKNRLPELDLPKIRKNPMVEIIPLSTGCLGACTYCKTRHARGKLGSYTPEVIVSRAQSVINEGVTEIWLSSEDTGAYGIDIGTDLPTLLRALIKIVPDGVMLRVGMTNPPYILSHLDAVAEVLNHDSVYSFLHVPVQAGSDDVLLAMNREYTSGDFRQVADHLLEKVPGLTLATDIICGFPGETEEHFDETMELVKQYRFHIMNISQFYPRPGTPAAKMKRVPTQVVKNRSRKLTKLFETFDPYPALVGTTQKVWINTEVSDDQKYTVAHTKNYTKVLLPRDDTLVGCSAHVKILSCARFHVTGEVVSRSEPPTKAAVAIRQEILTGGRLSSAELANNLLPTVNAASAASCGGDSGCGNCEDADVEDTSGSSDDTDCSGGGCGGSGGGCGGSGGGGCGGGAGGKSGGCCGGTEGDSCCSSGSNSSKYKKTKTTKTVAVSTSVAAVSATMHVDNVPPSRNSFIGDKFRQLCEDKIALAAVATIIASTALITGRLLFARK